MFAKPTLMSLAQNGTRPHRITSKLRSPALASYRTTGSGSVGANVPTRRDVRGRPMRRDREHQLDLADIGRETGTATHGGSIAASERGGQAAGHGNAIV